jgi:[acyl-carrier-protein] S-malonyltransferase
MGVIQPWSAVFPGQGSQGVGMGREILEGNGPGKARLEEADAMVAGGGHLLKAMLEGPAEILNRTEFTQPALFAVSAALWDELMAREVPAPAYVAGHSLGEYSALYAAGVLDFTTALSLVVRRGQLMQEAGQAAQGAMAAVIGLDDEAVEKAVTETGQGVVVANYNSPGQVVISGPKEGVEAAGVALKAAGAKRVLPLPVSGAFHSPAVAPANEALSAPIRDAVFSDPAVPVVMNVDGSPVTTAQAVRERLLVQMVSSVQWTRTVRMLESAGVRQVVEVGWNKVLAGLVKRIAATLETVGVSTPAEGQGWLG